MRIESTIEVRCRPEELFTLLTTPERIPEWAGSIQEAGRRAAGELAVGATFWNRVRFLGRTWEHEYRVTTYDPPSHFAFETVAATVPSRQSWRFEATGPCTRLDHVVVGEPGRFFGILTPLLRLLGSRQIRANLVTLKRLAEAGPAGPDRITPDPRRASRGT